jgi:predicted O-methyltransferase YrrM
MRILLPDVPLACRDVHRGDRYILRRLDDLSRSRARDAGGGSGERAPLVIGTEIDPHKVAAARSNLERAGLGAFADIRLGDARQTLRDIEGPIDFVLIDSWIPLARPMIEMLAPCLRPGAVVVCDNTAQFSERYRDYLDHVRSPKNGFRSTQMPYRGGLELSVRC